MELDEGQSADPIRGESTVVIEPAAESEGGEKDSESKRKAVAREFIDKAIARFNIMKEARSLQERRSYEEMKFNSGDHWPEELKKKAEGEEQVILEINRTPQFLNQVSNEERSAKLQILIKAKENATFETAQAIQGKIRDIESYGARPIRDDCFYSMLEKGWSFYRVNVEYENERSFDLCIRPGRFYNDFAVYYDPSAVERDLRDADDWIIFDDYPIDKYKAEFPDSELAGLDNSESLADPKKDWIGEQVYRVAEYFYKRRIRMRLFDMGPNVPGKFEDEIDAEAAKDRDWRWSFREKVYWCKFNAIEILDGNKDATAGREILGRFIPIIPMLGRRMYVENKFVYAGMVRDAIDPCRASDYWLSKITATIAMAPQAPWLAVAEATEDYHEMWQTANTGNWSTLFWKNKNAAGEDLPEPKRIFGEPPIQAMLQILEFADADIKKVMGIYNAALGAPGPESSGLAIKSRQRESDMANYNYMDSAQRAITFEAEVYIDLIPLVYKDRSKMHIMDTKGDSESVPLGAPYNDTNGKQIVHDMSKGRYVCVIEVGQGFATKREESVASMIEYLKMDQSAGPLIGDLIVSESDFPNKDEVSKRLRSRVDPELLPQPGQAEIPPKLLARMKQSDKIIEALTQRLKEVTEAMNSKVAEFQHEIELAKVKTVSSEKETELTQLVNLVVAEGKNQLAAYQAESQKLIKALEMAQPKGSPTAGA